MSKKRLGLYGGALAVIAAGLVYSLGIYPPASVRDGQGAIGQRQVYRAAQPKDANVTPGSAPVAMQADLDQMKKGQMFELKNGQLMRLSDGGFAWKVKNGAFYRLDDGQFTHLNNAQFAQLMHGLSADLHQDVSARLATHMMMRVSANQVVFRLNGDHFLAHLEYGNFMRLRNGMMARLQQNGFAEMNGKLLALSQNQIRANFVHP